MSKIKYAVVVLIAMTMLASAVEAKKIVTVRRAGTKRQRDREERARRERDKRRRAELKKKQQAYQKKVAEARKKRALQLQAAEKDRKDRAEKLRKDREEKEAAAKKAASEEKAMLGEYGIMATEVKLSVLQRTKLVAIAKKLRAAQQGKQESHKDEVARLTKAYHEARGQKKAIIAQALRDAKRKTARGARTSVESYHKQIMALLRPAQRQKWDGYNLAKDPLLRFEGIKLTDKQVRLVRKICDAAAKKLPKDPPADNAQAVKDAARKRRSVLRDIRAQIIYEVLTPEQRTIVKRQIAKALNG